MRALKPFLFVLMFFVVYTGIGIFFAMMAGEHWGNPSFASRVIVTDFALGIATGFILFMRMVFNDFE